MTARFIPSVVFLLLPFRLYIDISKKKTRKKDKKVDKYWIFSFFIPKKFLFQGIFERNKISPYSYFGKN